MGEASGLVRGPRRGFFWQDWYAAVRLLEAWFEPGHGITAVEIEAPNAPGIDDVIVHYQGGVDHFQLKHTTSENGKYTGSSLFGVAGDKPSVFRRLFVGWAARKRAGKTIRVHVLTNAAGSSSERSLLIAPVKFRDELLRLLRADPNWVVGEDQRGLLEALRDAAGAKDEETLLEFLRSLWLHFDAPEVGRLQRRAEDLLGARGVDPSRVGVLAQAWVGRVYDLATNPRGPSRWSRAEIGALLDDVLGQRRLREHVLALPEPHVERGEVLEALLERASRLANGYLLVVGPPGSGKTTLATWFADTLGDQLLARYHVFAPAIRTAAERRERAEASSFLANILDTLARRFPSTVPPHAHAGDRLTSATTAFVEALGRLASPDQRRFLIIDGLDHVLRAGVEERKRLFEVLPKTLPGGVVIVLFCQPDWPYPDWFDRLPVFNVPPFGCADVEELVGASLRWRPGEATEAVAARLHHRTKGNPLSLF